MGAYIVRRLLWLVFVLFVITAITYVIFFVMPPVNPAILFAGKVPTPTVVAEIKKQFGLDRPAWEQYLLYVKHVFLGDQYGWPGLGFSFVTRASVKSQLGGRLVVTATLAIGSAFIWLALGIPIGIASAVKRGKWQDRMGMGFALFFVSAPVFWLGLMFLWLFWFKLGWAAGSGYYAATQYGFFTWLNHMIMPWVVLALLEAAWYARMMRGSLLETMDEDFIRTARAKGLPERTVVLKHGVRASLVPIVTMFGMDLGLLFGGAIIVETVFNLQGIGQWAVTSVYNGDLPVILAVTLIASFAITLANVVVDICYALIDPRVRLG
ncbi:MAG TPA: ABC transporter permease [Actinomycetota bacterium]|nr:ABC transporter permease [Actinomycetota bacterium]